MHSTQHKDHLDGLAIGILIACCMFWGLQQILVKAVMAEVPPLMQASVRCIGACVLLMLWCRVRGIRLLERDGSLWAGLLAGGGRRLAGGAVGLEGGGALNGGFIPRWRVGARAEYHFNEQFSASLAVTHLRFADEPVRHKLLDLLGDLALAGLPQAQVFAFRGSHGLHTALARSLASAPAPSPATAS